MCKRFTTRPLKVPEVFDGVRIIHKPSVYTPSTNVKPPTTAISVFTSFQTRKKAGDYVQQEVEFSIEARQEWPKIENYN